MTRDTSILPPGQQTEVELLRLMAAAPSLPEQRAIGARLAAYRAERAATYRAGRELDLAAQAVEQLYPVAMVGPGVRTTAASDWLGEVDDPEQVDLGEVTQQMVAAASVWYRRVPEAVRAEPDEYAVQAHGMAAREASRYGRHAPAAARAFLDHAGHLAGRSVIGNEVPQVPSQYPPGSGLPPAVDNPQTFDDSLWGAAGPPDPGTITQTPSLVEGDAPEDDQPQQITNPTAFDAHDAAQPGVRPAVDYIDGTQTPPGWGSGMTTMTSLVAGRAREVLAEYPARWPTWPSREPGDPVTPPIGEPRSETPEEWQRREDELQRRVEEMAQQRAGRTAVGVGPAMPGVVVEPIPSSAQDQLTPSQQEGGPVEGGVPATGAPPVDLAPHDAGPGNGPAADEWDGQQYPFGAPGATGPTTQPMAARRPLSAVAASIQAHTLPAPCRPFLAALGHLRDVSESFGAVSGRAVVEALLRTGGTALPIPVQVELRAHLAPRAAGDLPPWLKGKGEDEADEDSDGGEPKDSDDDSDDQDESDKGDDEQDEDEKKTSAFRARVAAGLAARRYR